MITVISPKPQLLQIFQRLMLFAVPGLLTISTTVVSCSAHKSTGETKLPGIKTKVVRMGYQSSGDIVRMKGVLEKRLTPLGISVEWSQFSAGPQLMEALNVGKVDMGSVGGTPPIFAQAAGASLVYVAARQPTNGEGSGILVPKDSPIYSVAELKGKKVVFQKGSASHYLLVKALQEAGLKYSDIQALSLPPSDAREAFLQGKIEAWVTWDPYMAIAERVGHARVLRNAKGISTQGGFYIATKQFVIDNPELTRIVLEEIDKVGSWAESSPREVANLLAPELKLDPSLVEIVIRRRRHRLRPITPEIITEQQRIADLFYSIQVLPKAINLKDATLTPEQYTAITPTTISQK